jgi:hypothetical protein
MIELFRPIAGPLPAFDGYVGIAMPGRETPLLSIPKAITFGAKDFTSEVAPDQNDFDGAVVEAFSRDFYDRIHISEAIIDLGNVIGLQQRTVRIWNSFRRNQPLAGLTAENNDGITLTGQPTPPIDFAVFQEREYTITVSTDGPPAIDATYTWDFQPYDVVLHITGSRVTAWTFIPDWSTAITERIEWKTDVLVAYDGSEQTRSLRLAPRKMFEFQSFFTDKTRRFAEAIIWGWGAMSWALPIWPDGTDLDGAVALGDEEIAIDTATRDYAADGLAILLKDAFTFEVVEVLDVEPDRIVLKRPLAHAWGPGTRVYPARVARLNSQMAIPRWDGDASGARVVFELVNTVDHAADFGDVEYRDYPVLEWKPEWSGGFSLDMARKLSITDNVTGGKAVEDQSGMPSTAQAMRWTWVTRAEQDRYRALLYALRGRQGRIWVPTWTYDLTVAATIDASATNIDVEFIAYDKQVAMAPNRRDIRIELVDGSVYYRRITGSDDIGGGLERLGIDTPLGVQAEPDEVRFVSFMALARLDQDSIELAHWTYEVCDSSTIFKGVRNDV